MIVNISIKDSYNLHNLVSNSYNTPSSGRKTRTSRRLHRESSRHLICCRIPSKSLCRLVQVLVSMRLQFPLIPKRNIFSKPYQRHLFNKHSKRSSRTCPLLHPFRRSSKHCVPLTLVSRMKDLNWKTSMPRYRRTRVYCVAAYRIVTT